MRNMKKAAIIIVLVVLFTLLLALLLMKDNNSSENKNLSQNEGVKSISQQLKENNNEVINKELENKSVTIAIYGSDARSTEVSRSDIIMLIRFNPITKQAYLVSVPRDSRVEIPARGMDKINHAYAFGGAKLLTQTLDNLFKEKIDYYMVFRFDDFESIIDKLGGVKVNAKKDYGYDSDEPDVPKGVSILNGKQALFYVRFRYDQEGDFGRIRRQQEVIESIYQNLYERKNTDLEKTITQIYFNNLETNMDLPVLIDFYRILDKSSQINFETYMLETTDQYIDNIYYGIVNKESLDSIRKCLTQ